MKSLKPATYAMEICIPDLENMTRKYLAGRTGFNCVFRKSVFRLCRM